ncbi:30S ribosomal protein S20 [Candidatus Nomurabacteria bacterium]|nr:30S ribosomal protein S20 [Candidatus Nomurabacteria bacterium]
MPITKSAKKALRNSGRKRVFNIRRTRAVKSVTKDIEKLIKEGKTAEAEKQLSAAYKALDKAAKMNTMTKNTASRKKSRLSASIKRASSK